MMLLAGAASIALAVTVTAYVPANAVGAAGEPILPGLTCAVSRDLRGLLGSWIYVEGHGPRYVNDVTHRRFSRRVDLAMPCLLEARQHGKQQTKIRRESR